MLGPERFRFLNETHDLSDRGWDDPELDRLWRYNLHYFDDLNAEASKKRTEWHRGMLVRWVRENPPSAGTGWEPYPTSVRIVNWIKWSLGGNELHPACVHSLAVQARWLSRRLETHLLGNHLFMNAKALVFAGLFYEGPEAASWLRTGLNILHREIPEQILADGGQFERSPMYHALALEDMLDLANVTTTFADAIPASWRPTIAEWRERIEPMCHWLATMCHPDKDISFFNDAAIDIAPSWEALGRYASKLGFSDCGAASPPITHLRESGYIRVQQHDVVTILDVGPIGPTHLPAHAHADTLSFELSLFGQRVFVNSGTSCYGNGPERQRQRGTLAHNTVCVDASDSSEVWGGFRVARRAQPQDLALTQTREIVVECSHDGYQRLPGKPIHRRRWMFRDNGLDIDDEISGAFIQAQARLHVHPAMIIREPSLNDANHHCIVLQMPTGQAVSLDIEGGTLRREASRWHPQFGMSQPNLCLVVDFRDSRVRTHIVWRDTG